jgi:hypothetical protein
VPSADTEVAVKPDDTYSVRRAGDLVEQACTELHRCVGHIKSSFKYASHLGAICDARDELVRILVHLDDIEAPEKGA